MRDNLPSRCWARLRATSKHDKALSVLPDHADNRGLAGPTGSQIASHEDDGFSACKATCGPDLKQAVCLREELRAQGDHVVVLVQHPERIVCGDAINAAYLIDHVLGASHVASRLDAVHAPDASRLLKYGLIPRERKVGPTRPPVAKRTNAIPSAGRCA